MKILIELPTWLGDTVMTSPGIENLINHCGDVEITLLGSMASVQVFKDHPAVIKTFILDRNLINLFKTIRSFENFDLFFSFRSSFRAKIIKFFILSDRKYQFDKNKYKKIHQVEKYNQFINDSFNINKPAEKLKLYPEIGLLESLDRKLLGINPGASYGSAKRWNPKKFAEVAKTLSSKYDIIIFGGKNEKDIANFIENFLIQNKVHNYKNLAGKTSIKELIKHIAQIDLFITGDSGPMHIAAALQIPTISIFGPTNDIETSQWMNKKSKVVRKNLDCQPCMRRKCPLKHHNCMKQIEVSEIIDSIDSL